MFNNYVPTGNVPYNIQPNPIGNVMPISQQGYVGGYYNNMYNNYYNPYLAIQAQQAREAQFKEEQRKQSDIMKKISRAVNKAAGSDISDEDLNKIYDYKEPERCKTDTDSVEYMQSYVYNLHVNGLNYLPQDIQYINYFNSMYDKTRQEIPNDISMYEYNNKMSEQYIQMLLDKDKQKQKEISKLYNNNDYRKLLDMNSKSNSYFNSIFNGRTMDNNVTIDDMEISLPNHISNEYQTRRKMFIDAILNK